MGCFLIFSHWYFTIEFNNATDSCVLILHCANILNSLSSNSFGVTSLGFSLYSTMSSENSDSFTSSFPTWIPFTYFPYPIVVSRTTDIMLDKGGQRTHPDLRGNAFRFPLLSMVLATGLSYMDFIMLRYVPSIPTLLGVFNHIHMLNFVKTFFCLY